MSQAGPRLRPADKPAVAGRPDERPGPAPVEGIQRARLIVAMVEVAAEDRLLGATVGRVVARAGVSRRTFYEIFDSREDCFVAACMWGVERAKARMAEAYAHTTSWREGIRCAVAAGLAFLDAEPEVARVCVVEALGAGTLVLERRARVLQELADALVADAPKRRGGAPAPLLTAETVVGAAFAAIHTQLLLNDAAPLSGLLGQLLALTLFPYLGPEVAGEELARPAPPLPVRPAPAHGTSGRILERLDIRLTYRTVRCLRFVAAHPGASNREIAQGAEMKDEGQASKLLTRLAGVELLARQSPIPGKPNAWRLTPYGEQVLQAVVSAVE